MPACLVHVSSCLPPLRTLAIFLLLSFNWDPLLLSKSISSLKTSSPFRSTNLLRGTHANTRTAVWYLAVNWYNPSKPPFTGLIIFCSFLTACFSRAVVYIGKYYIFPLSELTNVGSLGHDSHCIRFLFCLLPNVEHEMQSVVQFHSKVWCIIFLSFSKSSTSCFGGMKFIISITASIICCSHKTLY